MALNSTLVILAEQASEFLPHQHKPERYVLPVVKDMASEWKRTKRRVADSIVANAVRVPLGVTQEGVYDAEDRLAQGLLVGNRVDALSERVTLHKVGQRLAVVHSMAKAFGTRPSDILIPCEEDALRKLAVDSYIYDIGTSSLHSAKATEVSLNEAPKPKLGRLGIGQVRNASGVLEDVFFDELDADAFKDITDNWKDTHYKAHFENYVSGGRPKSSGMVLKDKTGKVHGAALYRKFEDGSVELSHLETASFNRGKRGISGAGSNLLARAGLEADADSILFLTSEKESLGFYEKIGMVRQGPLAQGVTYEIDKNGVTAFADKMGVSKSATRKVVKDTTKEVAFTTASRSTMVKEVTSIMTDYKVFTGSLIKNALKSAKGDTIPQLVGVGTGRGGFTTVKLTKEGFQEVVDQLKWQKGFVDDVTKGMTQRVRDITKARYASSYDLRQDINRKFRIDRDRGLAKFHTDVEKRAQSVMANRVSPEQFKAGMRKDIEKNYRKLYAEGKGTTKLEKWETEFIRRQADSQNQYLDNFANYIQTKKDIGDELTSRVSQRSHLYAERGTSMFEAGHLSSLPDDVLVNWEMQPAEHCTTCPIYQVGGPYTKETLPGLPGEGFNVTRCGTNCKCSLQVSKLYVTDTPDVERELAVKVTKPKPPPVITGANRISATEVEFEGTSWVADSQKGRYRRYNSEGRLTGYRNKDRLPKEVSAAFSKKWTVPSTIKQATRTVTAPKPKLQQLTQTVSKPKGRPIPPEVRRGILTKDEVKRIDAAAKKASDVDFDAFKRSGIRDDMLVDELGFSRSDGKKYDQLFQKWSESSINVESAKMSVLNNTVEGHLGTQGLSNDMLKLLEDSPYNPSQREIKHFAASRRFNRQTAYHIHGNTTIAHRGVYGEYAKSSLDAAKEAGNSTIRVPTRALFSETKDLDLAKDFAGEGIDGERAVFTRKIKTRENLVDSYLTNTDLPEEEEEIISMSSSGFIDVIVSKAARSLQAGIYGK